MMDWRILLETHKHSLVLTTPLLAGSGALPLSATKTGSWWGAALTPLLWGNESARTPKEFARTAAGYLVPPGFGCVGWSNARRIFRQARYGGPPVAAVIAPDEPSFAAQMAADLSSWEGIQAIALYLFTDDMDTARRIVRAAQNETSLPLWVRLPANTTHEPWVDTLADCGAAAVIAAAPLPGKARLADGTWLEGDLHTPALVPYYTQLIAALPRTLPIIARADANSTRDVLAVLAAGAQLVILEGAVWASPGLAETINSDLETLAIRWGTGSDWDALLSRLRSQTV